MAEFLLGKIVSSGTALDNTSTAAPFTIPVLSRVYVQADAAGYILWGGTATSEGLLLASGQLFDTQSGRGTNANISFIPVSGSANLRVWAVRNG